MSLGTLGTTIFVAANSTATSVRKPGGRIASDPAGPDHTGEAADLTHVLASQLGWLSEQAVPTGVVDTLLPSR